MTSWTSRMLVFLLTSAFVAVIIWFLPSSFIDTNPDHRAIIDKLGIERSRVISICLAGVIYQLVNFIFKRWSKTQGKLPLYGLEHGKLHVPASLPMWMNMGYWKDATPGTTMAEACRDLLKAVLAEAGFHTMFENMLEPAPQRCLIDLGFGCGDQTVYLMSTEPVTAADTAWWDERQMCIKFDHYIGITNDAFQAQYALERVYQLKKSGSVVAKSRQKREPSNINLFCADAARPAAWGQVLQATIQKAIVQSQARWVLALDTAYHFSPSRWPIINHVHSQLDASFMAFDLCLSPTATLTQRVVLRILTALMGAPWANFVTPQEYRKKLEQAGYPKGDITVKDISEYVFTPLAEHLGDYDKLLRLYGLGIGKYRVAKMLFGWWGRTGVVRGVIVVAKIGTQATY